MSKTPSRAVSRSSVRYPLPAFWDGVAQAFDMRGKFVPRKTFTRRGSRVLVVMTHDWLDYATQASGVISGHTQSKDG